MADSSNNHPKTLNFNVGVLGHVDTGKTSLARALSSTASTAQLRAFTLVDSWTRVPHSHHHWGFTPLQPTLGMVILALCGWSAMETHFMKLLTC
uniref:Tr-type G domain-containing protein n=1 Tax=Hucho hucho TaxID=62062 RepID=A0A4W5NW70_9TELE